VDLAQSAESSEAPQHCSIDMQPLQQDRMIDGVKRCHHIQ